MGEERRVDLNMGNAIKANYKQLKVSRLVPDAIHAVGAAAVTVLVYYLLLLYNNQKVWRHMETGGCRVFVFLFCHTCTIA